MLAGRDFWWSSYFPSAEKKCDTINYKVDGNALFAPKRLNLISTSLDSHNITILIHNSTVKKDSLSEKGGETFCK